MKDLRYVFELLRRPPGRSLTKAPRAIMALGTLDGLCLGGGGRFFFGRWSHIACARLSDGRNVAKTSKVEIRRA